MLMEIKVISKRFCSANGNQSVPIKSFMDNKVPMEINQTIILLITRARATKSMSGKKIAGEKL